MYRLRSDCFCPHGLLLWSSRERDSEWGQQEHSPGKMWVGRREAGLLRGAGRQIEMSWDSLDTRLWRENAMLNCDSKPIMVI